MKTNLIFMLLIGVFVLSFTLGANEVNVTGKWVMTMTTPRGERVTNVEFIQKGEELTVITKNRDGEEIKSEGTVKGNKISWEITRETRRGTFTLSYEGTIDGDSMSGEVTIGERGGMEWTAERKKK